MIGEIVPGDKTRFNIIATIYKNRKINLNGLIREVRASPNRVLDYINELVKYRIIKEEKIKGKKKVHIRYLMPNFDNEIAKLIYSLIELDKQQLFFKKYKNLGRYFLQIEEELSNNNISILIYGSFSRFAADKNSDLDILILGKLEKEDVKRLKEIFITFENELSLKIEDVVAFLKNKDKPLYQNILKEHVIVNGVVNYLNVLGKIY